MEVLPWMMSAIMMIVLAVMVITDGLRMDALVCAPAGHPLQIHSDSGIKF